MKWKDSGDTPDLNAASSDDPQGPPSFSMGQESGFYHRTRTAFGGRTMPAVLVGGAVLILFVLLAWLFFGSNGGSALQPINDLEARVKTLEQRLAALENLSAAGPAAADQGKVIAELNKRIDGLESVLTKEIDSLSSRLAGLKPQKAAAAPAEKAAPLKPAPAAQENGKGTYHVVKPGENLYRISMQHGIKLNELLRLNNLKRDAAIRPGQKLLVKAR